MAAWKSWPDTLWSLTKSSYLLQQQELSLSRLSQEDVYDYLTQRQEFGGGGRFYQGADIMELEVFTDQRNWWKAKG